jgi:RimJ/RimL family protein N-acetyltransferase
LLYAWSSTCLRYGFDIFEIDKIYENMRPENISAITVSERFGMALEGSYSKIYNDKPMKHLIYSIPEK